MLDDARFAIRTLLHSRGFTAAAVVTLGIGIGANAVVFGVVDGLLLRPLPFGDRSGRLITLHSTHPTQATDWDDSDISYPDLVDLREGATTLEGIEGVVNRNVSLTASADAGDTERVLAASVTPGLFALLGVEPQLGRGFRDDEGAAAGAETVAIVSDSLWRRFFGSAPDIVGRPVPVNGRTLTVIGVMPPRFAFPEHRELWLPYRLPRGEGRDRRSMLAIGLVREGITLQAARGEVQALAADLAARFPATNQHWGVYAQPLRDYFVSDATRRGLAALLVSVVFVLLVACANIGSLLLARGIGRQREIAVRTALGAGRARLVRLLMTESLVLAAGGGVLGVLCAGWGLDALVASNPEPPPYWVRLAVDGRILGFCAALSVLTAIACGLLPALRVSRTDSSSGALHGGRAGASPAQRRLQGALVVGQIALSFSLLVGATLLAKSTLALQQADAGFDPRPLLSLRLYMAGDTHETPAARARALNAAIGRISTLPGVAGAGAIGAIPGDDGGDGIRLVPERGVSAPGEEIGAQAIPVASDVFGALGLQLIEGRAFTAAEVEQPEADVIVVNARLAARFWPGQSAIGRTLRIVEPQRTTACRIVGVAPDLVYEELGEETAQSQLNVYVPYARAGWRTMALLVRTPGNPAAVTGGVRGAVRATDPAFAAFDVMTMTERRLFTSWGERFVGRTFGAFAIAALLLACVGAYGLTAYAAAQRTREIGLRVAIGATRRAILQLLLARAVRLAAIGWLAGLPLAFASARLVQGLLFRVSPWTAEVWGLLPLALLGMVLLASFLPARRASLTDPATALRQD